MLDGLPGSKIGRLNMCKYCEGSFFGETSLTALTDKDKKAGIERIVEGGFLYAYCQCGTKVVTQIKYCPICGREL